jgi:hypothetical protein
VGLELGKNGREREHAVAIILEVRREGNPEFSVD